MIGTDLISKLQFSDAQLWYVMQLSDTETRNGTVHYERYLNIEDMQSSTRLKLIESYLPWSVCVYSRRGSQPLIQTHIFQKQFPVTNRSSHGIISLKSANIYF